MDSNRRPLYPYSGTVPLHHKDSYKGLFWIDHNINTPSKYMFNEHIMKLKQQCDEVAEWLRRWAANPMGSTCVGSNPIIV